MIEKDGPRIRDNGPANPRLAAEKGAPRTTIMLDVFTLEQIRAEVWDRALDHVWALSDPAYTILACVDPARDEPEAYLELVTLGDIGQAKRENPHRVIPSGSDPS